MPEEGSPWDLENFLEAFDVWSAREDPPADVRAAVLAWVFSRADDPYAGVQREAGFSNLWFGPVPRTVLRGTVVACSYWVEEQRRAVRCDSLATLSLPL